MKALLRKPNCLYGPVNSTANSASQPGTLTGCVDIDRETTEQKHKQITTHSKRPRSPLRAV